MGTFDPPHDGHVDTVTRAIKHGKLDIVYVETGVAGHKPKALPYLERVDMLEYVFRNVPQFRRVPKHILKYILEDQYMDAFGLLLKLHSQDDFFRIMGSDKFMSNTVKKMEGTGLQYIINIRDEVDLEVPYAQSVLTREETIVLPPAPFEVSSTDIRNATKSGYKHEHVDSEIYKRVLSLGGYKDPTCNRLLQF